MDLHYCSSCCEAIKQYKRALAQYKEDKNNNKETIKPERPYLCSKCIAIRSYYNFFNEMKSKEERRDQQPINVSFNKIIGFFYPNDKYSK